MNGVLSLTGDIAYEDLAPRTRPQTDPHFDITAMIDLVFMMNIYFLVTFVGIAMQEIDLPAADYCAPLDADVATIITVVAGPDAQTVHVFLGEGEDRRPLTDPAEQESQIADAVEAGAARGRTAVLIKAEKGVRLREMGRLAAAATREGVTLHLAVMEKDTAR